MSEVSARPRPTPAELDGARGKTVADLALGRPRAAVGEQEERLGQARVWLLPNPSGLQGHYRLEDVVAELRRLRSTLAATGGAR